MHDDDAIRGLDGEKFVVGAEAHPVTSSRKIANACS